MVYGGACYLLPLGRVTRNGAVLAGLIKMGVKYFELVVQINCQHTNHPMANARGAL